MRLRVLAAALAFGAGLLAGPAAAPSPAAGVGPLPECRLDDILTVPRDYASGPITLVDHILRVGRHYAPPDLVSVREGGVAGGGYVRELAIDDLRAMAKAADANGTPLVAWSPYRGYRQQKQLFNGYASAYGFDEAVTFSARPGHSEHQLGLAIDFVAVGDAGLTSNWEVTPTGGWMARNAWKYGWIMSYPKGKKATTCFSYEPWHYRYVGREIARAIHESGLTIREYLWANVTMVDPTTGEPLPTAWPSASAAPPSQATTNPPPTAEATDGPGSGPPATLPPTPGAGTGLDLAPPVALTGLLILLAAVTLVASRGLIRRSPRR